MFAFLRKSRVRWFLASTLVILLGGGALVYWYNRSSLSDFVGTDLRTLDDSQQSAFIRMLGEFLPDLFPGPRSKWHRLLGEVLPKELRSERDEFWYCWRLQAKTRSGFMLFQVRPDSPIVAIHFLGSSGQYQGKTEFSTRWPVEAAGLVDDELLGCPAFEIKIVAAVGRQIYGVIDNRIALLRIEDHAGKAVGNSYWYLPHQLGPAPPRRTKEEWEKLLRSPDPPDVLEGLTWIGGYHRREDEDWFGRESETLESVRLVEAIRKNPAVQRQIAALAVSENRWIREAAILAQQQLPKKAGQ